MPAHSKMLKSVMPEHNPDADENLRRRAYHLRVEERTEWSEVIKAIGYNRRTITKWIRAYQATGSFASARIAKKSIGKRKMRSLSVHAQNEMLALVLKKRDIYYKEVQWAVWTRTGEWASVSAIAAACKAHGITSKVATTFSLHRDREAMRTHAQLRSMYLQRQLVFVDECHKNGKEFGRRNAKSMAGERAYVPLMPHMGKAWTVLAAMDETGLVAAAIVQLAVGSADSDMPHALNRARWLELFEIHVLPTLNPADARRLARSVVVIDNASLHWGNEEEDEDEQQGRFMNQLHELSKSRRFVCPTTGRTVTPKLVYTPPYCPRANAIEAMFKAMNDDIRANTHGLSRTNPKQAIENGLMSVTREEATKLVRQSCLDVHSWL
jgi:transposase